MLLLPARRVMFGFVLCLVAAGSAAGQTVFPARDWQVVKPEVRSR